MAELGWYDDTSRAADDHLFWDGSTAWNAVKGCTAVITLGATVEAGNHGTNSYTFYDITTCGDRGTRAIQYHCCIN